MADDGNLNRIATALERIADSLGHQARNASATHVEEPRLAVGRDDESKGPPLFHNASRRTMVLQLVNRGEAATTISNALMQIGAQDVPGSVHLRGGSVPDHRLAPGENCALVFDLDLAASSLLNEEVIVEIPHTTPRHARGLVLMARFRPAPSKSHGPRWDLADETTTAAQT